jgi:oligogalacturonide transport system substrate-binding protein
MKSKKIMALALTAVLSLTALAGCSGKKDTPGNADGEQQVELRMSWWGGDSRHEATLAAIKRFEELNPNIKVKAEYTGWDGHQERITTQIGGRTAPDVMQINWNWLTIFSKTGDGFYDLNTLGDVFELDNYSKEALASTTVNGKLNGIPVSSTGRMLYLNKSTYDKFGVEIPTTWDDLIAAADKFEAGYYPIDLDAYSSWLITMSYIEQKTGKQFISSDGKLQFTLEEITDGLQFYKDLVDKNVTTSIQERTGEGGGSNAPLHQMPNYINGKYAGVYEWTSSVGKYNQPLTEQNQELVLANLPMLSNARATGVISKPSMLFSINKDTKHAKEAAKLLNFLLNDAEGVAIMGTQRGIPVSKSAVEVLSGEGKLKGLEFEGTEFVKANPGVGLSPYVEHTKLQELYTLTIEQLAYGRLDVNGAAKYLFDNVQKVLSDITR